ncbi:MAG: GGDEF domain-containing protein [Candidatus Dormibacteria bacterium]
MAVLRRGFDELRGWREWRLSTKLMVLLLVVAMVAIFFISKQNEVRSTALLTREQSKLQTAIANTVAIQVDSQILQYRSEIVQVASDPDVLAFMGTPADQRAQLGPALLKRLKPIIDAEPDFRLVLLADPTGQVAISNEPSLQGQNVADTEYFTKGSIASAGDPYVSDISLAEDRRSQIMYLAEPMRDAVGHQVGVAAIRLSPTRVAAPLRAKGLVSQHREGFLVNHDGVILSNSATTSLDYHSLGQLDPIQQQRVKKQFQLDQVESLNLDDLNNSVAGATAPGFAQAHLLGSHENDVVGFAPVPGMPWTVMVSEDQAIFTQDLRALSNGQFFNTLILALIIGGLVIFAGRMFETTERESLSDPLTGLANRRFFQEILLRELRRAQRANQPVSLVIADIDHFKGVNDTYGHNVGDEVLEQVAGIMLSSVRATDFVIRYGGEEFVILLPETRVADATAVADKLRKTIGDTILESTSRPGITLKVTVSAGVATFPADGQTGEQVILKADKSLYYAKQNGRNRVVTVTEMEQAGNADPLPAVRR